MASANAGGSQRNELTGMTPEEEWAWVRGDETTWVTVAETPWDMLNVSYGVAEFTYDVATGNYIGAAVTGVATVYDTAATLVPGLPGGANALLKGYRGSRVLKTGTLDTKHADLDLYYSLKRAENYNFDNPTPRTRTQKFIEGIRNALDFLDD